MRDLAISCASLDCASYLDEWRWLVPDHMEPLMIGVFGDWVFGAPDASHWHLDLLEGRFHKIANDSEDFNVKMEQSFYRNEWFGEDWANIAISSGLVPKQDECIGWKIAPILGGDFNLENIQLFPMSVYQLVTAGLFRHIAEN